MDPACFNPKRQKSQLVIFEYNYTISVSNRSIKIKYLQRRDGRQLQTSLAFLAKLMPFFLSTVTGEEISERNDLEETVSKI